MANQKDNQQRPTEGVRQGDRQSQTGQQTNRTGQQQQKSDMNKGSTRNSGSQINE